MRELLGLSDLPSVSSFSALADVLRSLFGLSDFSSLLGMRLVGSLDRVTVLADFWDDRVPFLLLLRPRLSDLFRFLVETSFDLFGTGGGDLRRSLETGPC